MAIDTRASYTAHAALSVSGTYQDGDSFTMVFKDLDEIPDGSAVDASIARGRPIMFPVFFEGTSSASVPNTTAGSGDALVNVAFLCCVDKPRIVFQNQNPKTGEMEILSDIGSHAVEVHDAYLTALFSAGGLDATIVNDVNATAETGAYPWAGKLYSGFMVRMAWGYHAE